MTTTKWQCALGWNNFSADCLKTKYYVQYRSSVETVARAVELAEEYVSRRGPESKEALRKENRYKSDKEERCSRSRSYKGKEKAESATSNEEKNREGTKPPRFKAEQQKKSFEAKKPVVCFNCQKAGHIAVGWSDLKVVFLSVSNSDDNMKSLEPHVRDLVVNGKPCRVLRDSAATMDVVHSSYV